MKLNNLIAISALLGVITFDDAVNALTENQSVGNSLRQ